MTDAQFIHALLLRLAIVLLLALLLAGCATYKPCGQSHFENLPGCPKPPVQLFGCSIYA